MNTKGPFKVAVMKELPAEYVGQPMIVVYAPAADAPAGKARIVAIVGPAFDVPGITLEDTIADAEAIAELGKV